ncbi:MAG: SDR family NAD(P)-dependent oxidoreductase, partial [Kiritimatiellia bacterium]
MTKTDGKRITGGKVPSGHGSKKPGQVIFGRATASGRAAAERAGIALPILRGLLAANSGNDDDRFSRTVLSPASAGRKPVLDIEKWQSSDTAETLRAAFKQALEKYRLKHKSSPAFVKFAGAGTFCVQRGGKTRGRPLQNKIALVTGAAGAIGAGICRKMLEEGCLVAAADLNAKALDSLGQELDPAARGRFIGVQMDVTDKESVTDGFARTIAQWGGVDIVVVNAGIAMVSPLMEIDPEAFRKLERVNVEGTLLTLAEAGKCMRRQNTGGDIVLISTKNVFAPGAQFGAYSATKAASHQLARIASLEYAP